MRIPSDPRKQFDLIRRLTAKWFITTIDRSAFVACAETKQEAIAESKQHCCGRAKAVRNTEYNAVFARKFKRAIRSGAMREQALRLAAERSR